MSVDQQDRYIAVGDAFHQFEARNIRQSRLDYREIEATGRQGLSRGPAATGANNGCSAELFKSSREGLTDTVICIYDEKFQHFDRSSPRYRCYYDTSLPPVVQVICEAETALACAPYLIRKANITLSARADQRANRTPPSGLLPRCCCISFCRRSGGSRYGRLPTYRDASALAD